MSKRLQDKRCLIVGGTSGLGLEAADRFLQEGAKVVIVGLQAPATETALNRLRPLGLVHGITADATQPDQVLNFFQEAEQFLKGLDVLYHVAGMSGRRLGDGSLHQCSDVGWQATIDGNLKSTFLTNREAVRFLLNQGQGGTILNMSSVLAWSPSPEHFDTVAYTAAKGGILSLSRLAAARYASVGIRINVLAPGLVDTIMSQRAVTDPEIQAYLQKKQPLFQGPAHPADCAGAAVFLCSDEAKPITGVVLPVDAGWCVTDLEPGSHGF